MSPAFVPSIKQLASQISSREAEQIVESAVLLKTTRQVTKFLQRQLKQLAPNLALLDTP